MPWVRIDENAMDHPKIGGLSDGAFRLWVQGLAYCQKYLTDGHIGDVALRSLRAYSPKRKADLLVSELWHASETGVRVHDYLQWNDSREHVMAARQFAKIRMALVRDPALRRAIQERDHGHCRYCAQPVNWTDRKSGKGATYDHVVPEGGDDLSNLVTACRSCNSRKGARTPEQAGMILLDPVIKPRFDLDNSSINTTPLHTTSQAKELPERNTARASTDRTQRFVDRYRELHQAHVGVAYLGNPQKDYSAACELVAAFDDAMLEAISVFGLNDPDPFMATGTRTLMKLKSRASDYAQHLKAKRLA